ncbi:hypothetical protein DCC25_10105 [Auritidibacter sp. NML120636]|nr:hypothetical protein DCC25_10105 [Auritidibacter sp. NML120636]
MELTHDTPNTGSDTRSKTLFKILLIGLLIAGLGMTSAPTALAQSQTNTAPTATEQHSDDAQTDELVAEPQIAWGAVIRIFTSKPACEAARVAYNAMFPDFHTLECQRSGSAWYLVRA